ncbi:hypothetical protein C5O19_21005 [Siphonobacter curvatus]|uniref:Uncharacterized protein n=2 Tax=Siphonobacter curvatus TaxID=2094562 RepID=A0A2S7IH58_9BACT|nr:hypothetical protein C5O19_21005 [Siphonobacter curvatus]
MSVTVFTPVLSWAAFVLIMSTYNEQPLPWPEKQMELKKATYYKRVELNMPRYSKVIDLLFQQKNALLEEALKDTLKRESEGCYTFITEERAKNESFPVVLPKTVQNQLATYLSPEEQNFLSYKVCSNGEVTIQIAHRTDRDKYINIVHWVSNFVHHKSPFYDHIYKAKKYKSYYYVIEVQEAFNQIDPCGLF